MRRLRRTWLSIRYRWAEFRFEHAWSVEARSKAAQDICRIIGEKWGGA